MLGRRSGMVRSFSYDATTRLDDPRDELSCELVEAEPEVCQFARRAGIRGDGITVVEEIRIEKNHVVRIDFDGNYFRVTSVSELCPTIDSVPTLADPGAVVEDDLYGDRKDEVALAVEVDGGEVLNLFLIAR